MDRWWHPHQQHHQWRRGAKPPPSSNTPSLCSSLWAMNFAKDFAIMAWEVSQCPRPHLILTVCLRKSQIKKFNVCVLAQWSCGGHRVAYQMVMNSLILNILVENDPERGWWHMPPMQLYDWFQIPCQKKTQTIQVPHLECYIRGSRISLKKILWPSFHPHSERVSAWRRPKIPPPQMRSFTQIPVSLINGASLVSPPHNCQMSRFWWHFVQLY